MAWTRAQYYKLAIRLALGRRLEPRFALESGHLEARSHPPTREYALLALAVVWPLCALRSLKESGEPEPARARVRGVG